MMRQKVDAAERKRRLWVARKRGLQMENRETTAQMEASNKTVCCRASNNNDCPSALKEI